MTPPQFSDTLGRREAIGCLSLPFLAISAVVAEAEDDDPPADADVVLRAGAITNASIDWELTPSLDAVVLLDEAASRLAQSEDRQEAVAICLRLLEDEQTFVAGHVILCHLFRLVNPVVDISGGRVTIKLWGLDVELTFSRDETFGRMTKKITYPLRERHTAWQRMNPSLWTQREHISWHNWDNLKRRGIADFEKFHPPPKKIPPGDAKNPPPRIAPTKLEKIVSAMIAAGVAWTFRGMSGPQPYFPQHDLRELLAHRRESATLCLTHLLKDDTWITAHILLTIVMETVHRYRADSRSDGLDLVIDGLTVSYRAIFQPEKVEYTYPRAEFEKHLLRYKWLQRAESGRWSTGGE